MTPFWQGFLLGAMAAWTPALVAFALMMRRAPELREDAETPQSDQEFKREWDRFFTSRARGVRTNT